MANSYVEYTGDGATTNRAVPFGYIDQDHVTVTVDGVSTSFTWVNASTISISPAPANGTAIRISRSSSPNTRLVDYQVGTLTEEDLDTDSKQAFYLCQEAVDRAAESMGLATDGNWDADSLRVTNAADAVDAQDLVTLAQLEAAALAPVTPTAASIANVPSGNLAGTTVQAALNELQGDINTLNTSVSAKAPTDSPAFTGSPTAPTPSPGDNDTSVATTAFVTAALAAYTPSAPAYILLEDQKASGTDGGTFTSGAWQTRTLNTEVLDTGNNCTLSSNQFTLAAGTYTFFAIAPAYDVQWHQLRLQNVTDATTVQLGYTAMTNSGTAQNQPAMVFGRFTISGSKTFELQHRCTLTGTTTGFGRSGSIGSGERYSCISLQKVA